MTVRQLLKAAKADYENEAETDAHLAIYHQDYPEAITLEAIARLRAANKTGRSITELAPKQQLKIFEEALKNL